RRLEVQGHRFLVGIELMEVPGVAIRFARLHAATRIAAAQILDFHHLGAEPGEGFGARRPRLELGEVHNANSVETIELDSSLHRWSLQLRGNGHCLPSPRQPHHPPGSVSPGRRAQRWSPILREPRRYEAEFCCLSGGHGAIGGGGAMMVVAKSNRWS